MILDAVGVKSRIVHVPDPFVPILASVLGLALRDVLLTNDEYQAMACGLAETSGPTTGSTRPSTWLDQVGDNIGLHDANELHRHFR
jgi:hypothetical protein